MGFIFYFTCYTICFKGPSISIMVSEIFLHFAFLSQDINEHFQVKLIARLCENESV